MVISQIETRNMRYPALGLKRDVSEESAHFSLKPYSDGNCFSGGRK